VTGYLKGTPPCRVLQSFEPAFAGLDPTRILRLGSSLSRHAREIGPIVVSVGSKPVLAATRAQQGNDFIPQIYPAEQMILLGVKPDVQIFNLLRLYR
jgi:hypothetical protein